MNKSEADLLRPYFEEQLHKAIATYSKKYKMTLPGPVQLEVYPDHEDFAVRTMGMPGLGALGVTFGEVVAMDSPLGRVPGEFNWGATMWHEMSHVFILTATNYRVPRGFTEGLAVHEEGQTDAEWANRLTPEVVGAIKNKKLLPVTNLDSGFIFPEYPEQVIVSYYQAGTIFGNVVLADEINRTPPKTQAAVPEAMQERSCTVRGHVYPLPAPFFVLATQNPIELEGTYPLPEAQLDRFLFNAVLDYLSAGDELKVVDLTTATKDPQVTAVTNAVELLEFQKLVRMVPIGESLAKYVVSLVRATRHKSENAPDFVKKYVNYGGASARRSLLCWRRRRGR